MVAPPFDPLAPRSAWAIALAGLIGCAEPVAEAPPVAAPEEVAPPEEVAVPSERDRAERTAELITWLRAASMLESDFHAPRVLYTWTRAEQIAELRERPVVLTRTENDRGERSAFDHAIEGDRSPLARHLRSRAHRARRFAWVSPWATRMAWPDTSYGDRLLRVELDPDAWIARFDASREPRWEVRDHAGRPVDSGEVARNPARVAAVYHVARTRRSDGAVHVFREYVLVSERMIRSVHVGTDGERLARDRAALELLADRLAPDSLPDDERFRSEGWASRLEARWRAVPPQPDLTALYESALALGSERYLPDAARVRAAAAALEIPVEPELVIVEPRVEVLRPYRRARSIWCGGDPTCW